MAITHIIPEDYPIKTYL